MARSSAIARRVRQLTSAVAAPEPVAGGVWVLRGGLPAKTMNVYLIEEADGGVTVFDAGIAAMAEGILAAAAAFGPIRQVVLGHADCDHRGAAPALSAPVLCHPRELDAARSHDPLRPYWHLDRLPPGVRSVYPHLLRSWDGGAVAIADTVQEGDAVAGFRVVELPGHAPGLIGLWRASDRLALASDCVYTLNPTTGLKGAPRIPHPAFDHDLLGVRRAIGRLAALQPDVAWFGHADPVTGDVAGQLRAVAARVP